MDIAKQAIELSGVTAERNPISVILNIESTDKTAHFYSGFCAIHPAPAGKPQWLGLRCYETKIEGSFLAATVLDQGQQKTYRFLIPQSLVLLVVEADTHPGAKESR
jgi:hypothetical protein